MYALVQDRASIEVDLIIANAVVAWPGELQQGPAFPARAVHLVPPDALVIGPRVPADAPLGDGLSRDPETAEWVLVEAALASGLLERLRKIDRPIRLLAARWSNAAAELVERLEGGGVPLDRRFVPAILGGTVGYWNSKIGGTELLRSISKVSERLPPSTVVASPAEAIAVAASHGGPAVLKANDAIGGVGVVSLNERSTPSEVQERLQATASGGTKKKGALVDLDGPYLLQSLVGSDARWSPSLDFLIEVERVTCIAAAEQVLDGFAYLGARFPGRAADSSIARCAELGLLVADRLRVLGYRGLLNIDFVVDGDELWLIELNVRQSAPLDQSLRSAAAFGPHWRGTHGFELLEEEGTLTWT